jgi:tRNA A37 threonylcarbamoyladenosine synthetase subunit TsaC/SUA5/YrdC
MPTDKATLTTTPTRRLLTDPTHAAQAARALADGMVVGHGFANMYALTARADRASVRRVNVMKGRPAAQVGSVTTTPSRISDLFDWDRLPAGLSRHTVLTVMDTLLDLGPFGFRGPAAAAVPAHLTWPDGDVVTTQVISPGYACPSNRFLARSLHATGDDLLYVTSANRSRHLSGSDDAPAYWRGDGLLAEFGAERAFVLLEHPDETAARAAYPQFQPMSTTILGFHHSAAGSAGHPHLVLERQGSLPIDDVEELLRALGLGLVIGPGARTRPLPRSYELPVAVGTPRR